jgi:hypothetical protein
LVPNRRDYNYNTNSANTYSRNRRVIIHQTLYAKEKGAKHKKHLKTGSKAQTLIK